MPTFAERVSSWLTGAPVGSHPLTRTEPYIEYEAKRQRRSSLSLKVAAGLVVFMLAITTCMSAYAAQSGHWQVVSGTQSRGAWSSGDTTTGKDDEQAKATMKFYWVSSSGDVPSQITYTVNGETKTFENGDSADKGVGPLTAAPTWAPDGWEISTSEQESADENSGISQDSEDQGSSESSSDNPMKDVAISSKTPDAEFSFNFVINSCWWLIWQICSCLMNGLINIANWFLEIMGVNAESAFTSNFSDGTFARFYEVAESVSKTAFQPYALAFLGIVFGIALMRPFDPRRRLHGSDQMAQLVLTVAMLAVSTTLILHAIELCGAIYWLAQNLVHGLSTILSGLGLSVGTVGNDGEKIGQGFIDAMDAVTYGEAPTSILLLVPALVATIFCMKCSFSVMTTIFLRVGEIYLRASASPLCLALLVDEQTKHAGLGYLKRFAAVCAQAVIIFLALGMMPLFFDVASTFISPVAAGASSTQDLGSLGTALAATIPSICAVAAMKGVVDRSESIANSLFGLAG